MKISVYITSYNQKKFLKEAVDSVLRQTILPFEILIIDDASTDGSQELILDYHEIHPQLVKYHFNNNNVGITKSRNKALSLVKGNYITGLDGDDAYFPRKLEVQKQLVEKTGATLVYTNFFYAEDSLDNLVKIWCAHKNQLPKNFNVHTEVLTRNFPYETLFRSELFHKDLIEKTGVYDEKLQIYEDFEFKVRLSKYAKTAYSIEPLKIYRIHSGGLSRKSNEVHLKNLKYIFNKHKEDVEIFSEKEKNKINQFIKRLELGNEPETSRKKESLLKRILNKF